MKKSMLMSAVALAAMIIAGSASAKDLNGATITQGDGIEIKKGSYANIVRDNVIHDVNYPGITMYDVNSNDSTWVLRDANGNRIVPAGP